jgi:hypothetical protein
MTISAPASARSCSRALAQLSLQIAFFVTVSLMGGRLSAQCGLTMTESPLDEAATGAYTMRATMNAPGAGGIGFSYQAPNRNIYYYGLPCDDPTNCSVPLYLTCTDIEKGDAGAWKITAIGHCDAGYQSVGPVALTVDIPAPTGELIPFWDQNGIFRITIKYTFPLGVDDGNAWICIPTTTGQCNGPVNATAKYFLHGSGEWTWRPTVATGTPVALYLHGCDTGDDTAFAYTPSVVVQADKPLGNGIEVGAQMIQPLTLPEHKAGQSVAATVPLGSRFILRLLKDGKPIPAYFGMGAATLEEVDANSLFSSAALIEFDAVTAATEKSFQAIHLGKQGVVLSAADGSATRTVAVEVVRPSALGDAPHQISTASGALDLDSLVVDWAHRRGILPQVIKGIVKRESSFNPMSWRYEPLVTDWDRFSPLGDDDRELDSFSFYRMEWAGTPRGILLQAPDLQPRNVFYLDREANLKIADPDMLVTAYTIVSQNEISQHWLKVLQSQDKKDLLTDDLIMQTLSWTSQTTLASSYGLMQTLYEEWFADGVPGVNNTRRPFYLFDTKANVDAGGGSVPTGTDVFVRKFLKSGEASPHFTLVDDFDQLLKKTLGRYNGSYNPKTQDFTSDYAEKVMAFSQFYWPASGTAILH